MGTYFPQKTIKAQRFRSPKIILNSVCYLIDETVCTEDFVVFGIP